MAEDNSHTNAASKPTAVVVEEADQKAPAEILVVPSPESRAAYETQKKEAGGGQTPATKRVSKGLGSRKNKPPAPDVTNTSTPAIGLRNRTLAEAQKKEASDGQAAIEPRRVSKVLGLSRKDKQVATPPAATDRTSTSTTTPTVGLRNRTLAEAQQEAHASLTKEREVQASLVGKDRRVQVGTATGDDPLNVSAVTETSEPGAVHVSFPLHDNAYEEQEDMDTSSPGTDLQALAEQTSIPQDVMAEEGMLLHGDLKTIEATPVEELELAHAVQVKDKKCWKIAWWILALLAIVGTGIGTWLGVSAAKGGGEDKEDTSNQHTYPQSSNTFTLDFLPDYTNETIAGDPDDMLPQTKAVEWLRNNHAAFPNFPLRRQQQIFAMVTFYFATDGPNWKNQDLWLSTDSSECYWQDPEEDDCHASDKLRRLKVPSNGLVGTLPPEISLLTLLSQMDLQSNSLFQTLPTELGKMTSLVELLLTNNGLTGALPSEMGRLESLKRLILQQNDFAGSLPTQLGQSTSLVRLSLFENSFMGTLPSQLGRLTSNTHLSLQDNNFTGSIASELAQMTALKRLSWFRNNFSGSLPTQIGGMTKLTHMSLHGNALTGPLPTELGTMASMELLSLQENSFSGSLPTQLGAMTAITRLSLFNNAFSGTLFPTELFQLPLLNWYNVSYNPQLTGQLPSQLGRMTFLSAIAMIATQLSGSVPSELGQLSLLEALEFSYTSLTGSIPQYICNIADLEYLYVDCEEVMCNCSVCKCGGFP